MEDLRELQLELILTWHFPLYRLTRFLPVCNIYWVRPQTNSRLTWDYDICVFHNCDSLPEFWRSYFQKLIHHILVYHIASCRTLFCLLSYRVWNRARTYNFLVFQVLRCLICDPCTSLWTSVSKWSWNNCNIQSWNLPLTWLPLCQNSNRDWLKPGWTEFLSNEFFVISRDITENIGVCK